MAAALTAATTGVPPARSAADAAPAERPVVTPQEHPLTDVPKGRSATEQVLRFPAWLAERPFWALGRGLEGTLTWVEQKDLIHRIAALPHWLRRNHLIVAPSAQGTGSGTGLLVGTFAGVGPGAIVATTDWTVREYQAHVLQLRMPISGSVGVRAFGRYDRRMRDNFYGVGSATTEDDRTQYRQASLSAGASLGWRAGGWTLRAEGGWSDYDALEDPNHDEHPSTRDALPGLPGEDGPTLASGGVAAGRSAPGSRVEAGVHVYHDPDDEKYGFTRSTLTLEGTVPVFGGGRELALRFHGVTTDPHEGRTVPFWMVAEAGARNGLRAYDAARFRDLDAVVMNAEYRFPIWDIGTASGAAIETVLFFDAGRVSAAIEDDLAWRELKSDAGFGFRARTRHAMLARVDAAFASDTWRLQMVTGRDF